MWQKYVTNNIILRLIAPLKTDRHGGGRESLATLFFSRQMENLTRWMLVGKYAVLL